MGLETVNDNGNARLNELDTANPTGTDNKNQGDDHIRNIKKAIKDQFSGISGDSGSGAVTATAAELNLLDGVTATTDELNLMDGVTATTTELNLMDGVTATTTELNLLDGITATTTELNILDGVTATSTELNLMDGCTSTTAELNTLAGSGITSTTMTNLAGLSAHEIDTLQDISTGLSATELNYVNGVTGSIQTQIDGKQAIMSEGKNVDISSNTIEATGCPNVVVGDVDTTTTRTDINTSWVYLPVNTKIHDNIGATENDTYVYLPIGTYYFEADCHIRNSSYSNGIGSVRGQLVKSTGAVVGYEHNTRVGESGEVTLQPSGKFTISGTTAFRLRVVASESNRAKYNDTGSTATKLASRIKFWKVL